MKTGDVIRLTHFANYSPGWISHWKAPKKQVFVAVILGVEAKDGKDPLNVIEAFSHMGWMPDPEKFDDETLTQLKEMHQITD